MSRLGRAGRWAAIGLSVLLGSVLIVAVGAYLFLQSGAGRDVVARSLSRSLSGGGVSVDIGRIEAGLPQRVALGDVTLSDARGEWLRLGTIDAAWRPLELLRGRLHVTRLNVSDVVVSRTPESGEDGASPTTIEPTVPAFSVALDNIELNNVTLAQPVLGEPLTLRGSGHSRLGLDGVVTTRFTLERTDGEPGEASLDARFDHGGDRLALNAHLSTPQGGTLANALGLPGLDVQVSGDGPPKNWRASLSMRSGDAAAVTSSIVFQFDDDRYRLVLEGNADIARLLPPPGRELVGNGVSFALDARSPDFNTLELEAARFTGDAGSMELSGVISASNIDVRARARFTQPGLAWLGSRTGVHADTLDLSLHAAGALLQPRLDVDIESPALAVDDGAERVVAAEALSATFGIVPRSPWTRGGLPASITGKGRADGVHTGVEYLEALLTGPVSWTFEGDLDEGPSGLDVAQAGLSTASAELTATGRIGLTGAAPDQEADTRLAVSAVLPELSRFRPLIGIERGTARIETDFRMTGFGSGFAASVKGAFGDAGFDIALVDALVAPSLDVDAELTVDAGGALDITRLEARGNEAALDGRIGFSADFDTLRADYRLRLDRLANLPPDEASGAAVIEGSASGATTDPSLTGSAAFTDVAIAGFEAGAGRLEYQVDRVGSHPVGRASMNIEHAAAGSVDIASRFDIADFESVALEQFSIDANGLSARGNLRIPFDEPLIEGSLSGRIDELDRWSGLIGTGMSGSAVFDLNLDVVSGRQEASSMIRVTNGALRIGDASFAMGELTLNARARDLLGTPGGAGTLEVREAKAGDTRIERLTVNVDAADVDHAAFDVALDAALPAALRVNTTGSLSRRATDLEVRLRDLDARFAGHPLRLESPATVAFGPETLSIDDLSLAVGSGSVRGGAAFHGQNIDARVEVRGLPLPLLDVAYPQARLRGQLSGMADLTGTRARPTGNLSLQLVDVQQDTAMGMRLPKLAGTITGQWDRGVLALDGKVTGLTASGLKVNAKLPLELAPDSSAPRLPLDKPVFAGLAWRGPIEPFLRLLALEQHDLSGIADVNVDIGGTLGTPEIGGAVKLEQGTYEHPSTATLIKDASIVLKGNGSRLTATGTATDGGRGKLRAEGEMVFSVEGAWPLDLRIELDKATLVRLEELTATASGAVTVTGTLTDATLRGKLVTDHVEARIVDSTGPNVVELDVVEVNRPDDTPGGNGETAAAAKPTFLELDIDLGLPGRVFVRGRGLDTEWNGRLTVSGTPTAPVVAGVLRPVRGGFAFAGKKFALRTGSVRFDGTDKLDPLLNLPFEYSSADITAIVSITGRASAPEMKMTSRPPLPESEILSRVLFGKDAQELTTGQKIELAGAVAELTGSGVGLMDKARNTLGVDVLTVDESADGATTKLKAGKYLSERVYVEMEKGAEKNTGEATIEVEIAPRVKVQTGSKGEGEGKVGIEWRWDY